jgi:hypothetical protein
MRKYLNNAIKDVGSFPKLSSKDFLVVMLGANGQWQLKSDYLPQTWNIQRNIVG